MGRTQRSADVGRLSALPKNKKWRQQKTEGLLLSSERQRRERKFFRHYKKFILHFRIPGLIS